MHIGDGRIINELQRAFGQSTGSVCDDMRNYVRVEWRAI